MALKDLKSDLSKFRRPVEKPLVEKERKSVPKSTNQTPLSQFVDKTPSAPKSNTTTPKQGVTPNKFDNSSNFLGETTQNKFDNSSNYLGETTPTKMSLSERFLGETETQKVQQGDKFKGETETANITQGDRFKGQTTPQDYSNAEKFKGETNPTEFKFVKQFLGETSPSNFDNSSNFLGETTQVEFDNESKFLGETTPSLFNMSSNKESQAVTPTYVNFITDDDAKGFSPFQQPKNNSTFVGVDPSQTKFKGITPISGQFVVKQYNVTKENDKGLGKNYTDDVLKTTYNKFNLKQDSYNKSIFKQPFILSGIQRKKGEPQTLGFGSFSFIRGGAITSTARAAIDLVRLGEFLLTPRGLTWSLKQVGMQRSQRYGKKWTPVNLLANIGGQHLGLKFDRPGTLPVGDETWKYNTDGYLKDIYNVFRVSTDVASLPLRVDPRGGFDSFYGIGATTYTRQHNSFFTKGQGEQDARVNFEQKINPFDTLFTPYGDTIPTTDDDSKKFGIADSIGTIHESLNDQTANQAKSDDRANFSQKVNPTSPEFSEDSLYSKTIKTNTDGDVVGSLLTQVDSNADTNVDKIFRDRGLDSSDGLIPDKPDIADYEFMSYGKIQKRAQKSPSITNDFREDSGKEAAERAAFNDYSQFNVEKRVNFGNPGKFGAKRVDWTNTDKTNADNAGRWDEVTANEVGNNPKNDLVHLFFYTLNGGDRLQFRGTASGITETFSPSWNSEKPNGRADKVYMYSEFERTLSFNFKAYATSRVEMKPMWKKLQKLSTFTMPTYGTPGYRGNIVYFRLGNLYGNGTAGVPSLITSLSYTMSDDVSWDISLEGAKNPIGEIPKMVDVTIGLTLLPETLNEYGAKTYSAGWF